ncbi:rhodanese-like domain-containing protein [Brevundimonas sp.]|uniref:rhodanese-like domain-containing protein n=1 Tax=Brevundimonas sp. TaxID=1871086 RepID=UPI003BAC182A
MSPVAAITVEEAHALLTADEAVLIDVREADEFAAARIDGAVFAPLSEMPAVWQTLTFPAGKTIIVQCLKGGRSAQVCGFVGPTGPDGQAVVNMTGGIQAWHAAGLPILQG